MPNHNIGDIIDNKIELVEVIGRGGTSSVWKGYHNLLEKHVAIKLLDDISPGRLMGYIQRGLLNPKELFRRDIQENRCLVGLENIADFYGEGWVDENRTDIYIVQELIEGNNLSQYLKSNEVSKEESLDIIIQIANALREAHKRNRIHKDLKPDNIMIDDKGYVKIIDWGLGESPGKRNLMSGSLPYTSPESILGNVSPQSDIWSLSVDAYFMIKGQLPFTSSIQDWSTLEEIERKKQESEIAEKILNFDIVPSPLDDSELNHIIVKRGLSKDLGNRYKSSEEMLEDLLGFKNKSVKVFVESNPNIFVDDSNFSELMIRLLNKNRGNCDIDEYQYRIDDQINAKKWNKFNVSEDYFVKGYTTGLKIEEFKIREKLGERREDLLEECKLRVKNIINSTENYNKDFGLGTIIDSSLIPMYELLDSIGDKDKNEILDYILSQKSLLMKRFDEESGIFQMRGSEIGKGDDAGVIYANMMYKFIPALKWINDKVDDKKLDFMINSHINNSIESLILENGSVLFGSDNKHKEILNVSLANMVYGLSLFSGYDNIIEKMLSNIGDNPILNFSKEIDSPDVYATSILGLGKQNLGIDAKNHANSILNYICTDENREAMFKFTSLFEKGGFFVRDQYPIYNEYPVVKFISKYIK